MFCRGSVIKAVTQDEGDQISIFFFLSEYKTTQIRGVTCHQANAVLTWEAYLLLVDLTPLCNPGFKMNLMGEEGWGKHCSVASWSGTSLDMEETCLLPAAYVFSLSCTMNL